MSLKDDYQKKLQLKLKELQVKLEKIQLEAQEASADLKESYNKEVEALKVKKQVFEKKLDELSHAGDDAWEELKAGVESAWTSLSDGFDSAVKRFRDK